MEETKIDAIITNTLNYIFKNLIPITDSIGEEIEGNIFSHYKDFLPKQRNIVLTCQNRKNALEIGFNAGFSSLLILLSNPDIQLTCVDIAFHRYTIPCYEQIKKDFGDRINLLIGDSQVVVPMITDKFDLVHIDGGHGLHVAANDIVNTNKLLMNNAIIVMDDTDVLELADLWNRLANQYNYKEPPFKLYSSQAHDVRVNS